MQLHLTVRCYLQKGNHWTRIRLRGNREYMLIGHSDTVADLGGFCDWSLCLAKHNKVREVRPLGDCGGITPQGKFVISDLRNSKSWTTYCQI